MKTLTILLIFLPIIIHCYLELPLVREQLKYDMKGKSPVCLTASSNDQVELCYFKDIAYTIQLYNKDQLYHLAIDFTSPISWIKNQNCKIQGQNRACNRIEIPVKEKIRKKLKHEKAAQKTEKIETSQSQTFKSIVGMDRISGQLERFINLEFWTRDSSKLTSFYNLLLVGLFMTDEKDKLALSNTNFINASVISNRVNSLCDGAVSIRFDEESENSFLNEIFTTVKETQKVVTIYVGANSMITIGALSVKNAEEGYSGIQWIELDDKRYPVLTKLTIQTQNEEQVQSIQISSEICFTLSASYISLPTKAIEQFMLYLNASCKLTDWKFVQCNDDDSLLQKKIIFEIGDIKISIELERLIKSSRKKVLLNIRQSETNFMIIGQPIFQKYFFALDHGNNKIGVALKRITFKEKIFDVITLVRFLTFVFFVGYCTLVCFNPVRKMCKSFSLFYRMNNPNVTVRSERNGLRYANVQENGYEDIQGKIQGVLSENEGNL